MKINTFPGDLTDISAKKEALTNTWTFTASAVCVVLSRLVSSMVYLGIKRYLFSVCLGSKRYLYGGLSGYQQTSRFVVSWYQSSLNSGTNTNQGNIFRVGVNLYTWTCTIWHAGTESSTRFVFCCALSGIVYGWHWAIYGTSALLDATWCSISTHW